VAEEKKSPQQDNRTPQRGRGPRRGRPFPGGGPGDGAQEKEFAEKVLYINRSAKVVKGGRRFSFSALVVAGDRKGRVGLGLGKAREVAEAIRKGSEIARQSLSSIALREATIPHEVLAEYGGAQVLLRPASPGTGVIAGRTVRAVLESAGLRDVLSKSLGSKNAANVAKATLKALQQLRLREEIYRLRGRPLPKPAASPPAPESEPEPVSETANA
jgi:small subunit ribosomal protein S5